MTSTFKEALDSEKFVVTVEISPPKGTIIDEVLENIDLLKDKVDALNVADNQDAIMRLNPLSICHLIKDGGGGTNFTNDLPGQKSFSFAI